MYRFLKWLNGPQGKYIYWITNSSKELGLRFFGINLWYYKWPDPMISPSSDDNKFWRRIEKREFGEVIRSS